MFADDIMVNDYRLKKKINNHHPPDSQFVHRKLKFVGFNILFQLRIKLFIPTAYLSFQKSIIYTKCAIHVLT